MHLLICDDDALFAARVEKLVRSYFERRGIGLECTVCTSGEQALACQERDVAQVALLDVDLETTNGIALGRQLKQANPDVVLVYISAYLEFAPEGYTVHAFRYLLKRDIERTLPLCLEAVLAEHARGGRTLTIHLGRSAVELPLDKIYYLESDLRKINVYGEEPHRILYTYYDKLTDLPDEVFENGFLRVGRSTVVNMQYIRQLRNYKVELQNGVELSVSRNGYAAIRSIYLEWKGQFGNDL